MTSEPAKKNRGGRPKREEASAASSTSRRGRGISTEGSGTKPARATTARGAKGTATSSPMVVDDLADLLQLEEDNQRLRKSPPEKLRAENASLRDRLGLK